MKFNVLTSHSCPDNIKLKNFHKNLGNYSHLTSLVAFKEIKNSALHFQRNYLHTSFHSRVENKFLPIRRAFGTTTSKLSDKDPIETTELSHVDKKGSLQMVDVSPKSETLRVAKAAGRVFVSPEILKAVKENAMKKGDVLTTAKIAGIIAVKKTPDLIPLCHSLNLTHISVEAVINENDCCIDITSQVSCKGSTGVEMEALTGVSVAALTVYDMCKAMSHNIVISDIKLMMKSGGKRDYLRAE